MLRYSEAGAHFSPLGPFGPVLDEAGVRAKFARLAAAAASGWGRGEASPTLVADGILAETNSGP